MGFSRFEKFIRAGGNRSFLLKRSNLPWLEWKQVASKLKVFTVGWPMSGTKATAQAILKTEPFEFSTAGLASLDQEALKQEAVTVVSDATECEGFDLFSDDGEQRAIAVLFGFPNEKQQAAMGSEGYWQRVIGGRPVHRDHW